jgi:phage terminase large subunit-like protein
VATRTPPRPPGPTPARTRGSASSTANPRRRRVPIQPPCAGCGWRPRSGSLWPSHGQLAVDWIEQFLIFGEGDFFGQPFRLRDDQKLFLYRWYEHCARCGQWRYDEGLRGAASGDGKTAFVAAIVCVEFAGPEQIAPRSPLIPIAAASFEQADLLFGACATMLGGQDDAVKEAPLCGYFNVYDTEITFKDGRPGKIHRVAAVAGTNEGGLPHLFVADELHEWGDVGSNKARVHVVISKSTRKRRTPRGSGRVLNLSTAGFDVDHSLLGRMYKLGVRARRDPKLSPRYLFDWQEAPDGLDYADPAQREIAVRAASQAAGLQWSVADRVADYTKPGMERHEWIRYFANRWVELAEESWLADHPAAWAECQGTWRSNQANPFVLSVDMALKRDSVAVDRLERLPDGRTAVTARIWMPADGRIDHLDVFTHVLTEATGTGFRAVVYDPRYFEVPGRMLEDRGITIVEFDQDPRRMAPACGLAWDLIVARKIVQDGDPEFGAHVKAAVKRQQERGFTLSKGKSKRRIDAAVSLCMGVWVLEELANVVPPVPLAASPAADPTASAASDRALWRPSQRLTL